MRTIVILLLCLGLFVSTYLADDDDDDDDDYDLYLDDDDNKFIYMLKQNFGSACGKKSNKLIIPCNDSFVLQPGENITLKCVRETYVWYNRTGENLKSYGKRNISIDLIDVSARNVGAFFCADKLGYYYEIGAYEPILYNSVKRDNAELIYIYVNDSKNLMVPFDNILFGIVGRELYIPCKPTMPRTEVMMTFNNKTYFSNSTVDYDSERGFFLSLRSIADSGKYQCRPKMPSPDNVGEMIEINLRVIECIPTFIEAKTKMELTASFESLNQPSFTWYEGDFSIIDRNRVEYNISITKNSTTLIRKYEKTAEHDIYIVKGSDNKDFELKCFNLTVFSPPSIRILNKRGTLKTEITSWPKANVTFEFKPRLQIKPKNITNYFNITEESLKFDMYTYEFIPSLITCGTLICKATNNYFGTNYFDEVSREVSVLPEIAICDAETYYDQIPTCDNYNGSCNTQARFAIERESKRFACFVQGYNDVSWYHNEKTLDSEEHENSISVLEIQNFSAKDSGTYKCCSDYFSLCQELNVILVEAEVPQWEHTSFSDNSVMDLGYNDVISLECNATSNIPVIIEWFKDNDHRDTCKNPNKLEVFRLEASDSGVYKCVASNWKGSIQKTVTVNISALRTSWVRLLIVICLLVTFCIFTSVRYFLIRKKHKALRIAFEQGGNINPDILISEQANLLPYDPKYEFSPKNLNLVEQLGAGAYGIVYKGEAKDINDMETVTTVAVKMVDRTASENAVKALISELKIMIHLGQHLNVVNLLGAVTKNIIKRELMVIVEYCCFGCIQDILRSNRQAFINQINSTLNTTDLNGSTQNVAKNSLKYAAMEFTSTTDDYDKYRNPNLPFSDETNSSTITITTTHLVSWALQVARGMEYLTSRRVVHGDLATRNILLCEKNVVKICDFGLARSTDTTGIYMKSGNDAMPIKWIALESLKYRKFSIYSDVWSFGVTLWELFSLAQSPYDEVALDKLFELLSTGYRMSQPPYANLHIYNIMLDCWNESPEQRPLFHQLEKQFSSMLNEQLTGDCVSMNNIHMVSNAREMNNQTTDYMEMMQAPEGPIYINAISSGRNALKDEAIELQKTKNIGNRHVKSGYLEMKPLQSMINKNGVDANIKAISNPNYS